MVIYSDSLVPKGFAGIALGPVIVIRPAYRDDQGLLAHEQVHVEQWKRARFTHFWRYWRDLDYRLRCEVEAYRVQIKVTMVQHPNHNRAELIWKFSWFIARKYGLDITHERAYELLEM